MERAWLVRKSLTLLIKISLLSLYVCYAAEVDGTSNSEEDSFSNYFPLEDVHIDITSPSPNTEIVLGDEKFEQLIRVSIDIGDEAAKFLAGKQLQVCVAVDYRLSRSCIPLKGSNSFSLSEPTQGYHQLKAWMETTSELPHQIVSIAPPVAFTAVQPKSLENVSPPEPTLLSTWINEENLPEVQLGVVLGTGDTTEEVPVSWPLESTPGQVATEFCKNHIDIAAEGDAAREVLHSCTNSVEQGLWSLKPTRRFIRQIQPKPRAYAEIGIGMGCTALHVYEELEPGAKMYLFGYDNEVNDTLVKVDIWKQKRKALGYQDREVSIHPMRNSHQQRDSYVWNLARMLADTGGNFLDYVYLDGSHDLTIETASLAFIERLLKPGGWIEFDDYTWTYGFSNSVYGFDEDNDILYTKEQQEVPHVKVLVDLLVKGNTDYIEIVPDRLYQKIDRDA